MLEHQQAVGYADTKGSAGTTLTDHCGDHRDPQPEHLAQIDGDGFTLPLLLGHPTTQAPEELDPSLNPDLPIDHDLLATGEVACDLQQQQQHVQIDVMTSSFSVISVSLLEEVI